MRSRTALLLSAVLLLPALANAEEFGRFSKDKVNQSDLKTFVDKDPPVGLVQAKGTVEKVCEKGGCWMTINDKGQSMRIVFKDHSFFVSNKLIGKPVLVEGIVKKSEKSVAEQKHYLQDEGATKEKIDAITKPLVSVHFEASGVRTL